MLNVEPEFESATNRLVGPLKSLLVTVSIVCLLLIVLPNGGAVIRRSAALTLALPGVSLIYFATRPARSMLTAALLLALTTFLAFAHACANSIEVLLLAGASVGLGSFLLLALRTLGVGRIRRGSLAPFGAAVVLLTFSASVGLFFKLTVVLAPTTYDIFLYVFDQKLGFQSSFLLGQLFAAWPLLGAVAHFAYMLVPMAIAALYAAQLRRATPVPAHIMAAFTIAAATGWMLYMVYPAAGPIYAFGALFPANPPLVSQLRLESLALPVAARNCMPSLHMAWALLVLWNSRPFGRWIRLIATVFFLLTMLATLGLGEHYAIDLVVAIPFATAVQAACTTSVPLRLKARLAPLLVGAGLTSVWILGLRLGVQSFVSSPVVCWALVAGTLIPSILLEMGLARVGFEALDAAMGRMAVSRRGSASGWGTGPEGPCPASWARARSLATGAEPAPLAAVAARTAEIRRLEE